MGNPTEPYAARFTQGVAFVILKLQLKAFKYMKQRINKQKHKKTWIWPIIVFVLAISLSLIFSIASELVLNKSTTIIAIVVIFVFIALAILTDMIGLAVASANLEDFNAMAARKVKGSKQALALVRNADKVSSVLNDVIGDVCGILSGAAGASIVAKIAFDNGGDFIAILIPSLIAAVIAGLTIGGKAIFKRVAIRHADSITLTFARFVNFFTRKG